MRSLTTWLFAALLSIGLFAGIYHYHLENHPRRVLVVIDSSAAMRPDWPALDALLKRLSQRRYSVFALATEKDLRHVWSEQIDRGTLRPSGARNFDALLDDSAHLDFDDLTDRLLISNADDEMIAPLRAAGWRHLRP